MKYTFTSLYAFNVIRVLIYYDINVPKFLKVQYIRANTHIAQNPAQKKIVWETSLGQSLGKSLGVLEKSLA